MTSTGDDHPGSADMPDLMYRDNITAEVKRLTPHFEDLFGLFIETLTRVERGTTRSLNHASVALILNQGLNDVYSLGMELSTADGRPATRTARALIESAINLHSVRTDPSEMARYIDHHVIADYRESEGILGLAYLSGPELRAERHRLKKLARSRVPMEASVQKYGKRFKTQWSSASLADRADRAGVPDLYDYYRVASHTLHGAAGGAKATAEHLGTKGEINGDPVSDVSHWIGPAVSLCPAAYLYGVKATTFLFEQLADISGTQVVEDMRIASEALCHYWPEYRRACIQVGKAIRELPAQASFRSLLIVQPSGEWRWACLDNERWQLADARVEGHPHALAEALEAAALWRAGGRQGEFVVEFDGVQAVPDDPANWREPPEILRLGVPSPLSSELTLRVDLASWLDAGA